jgi:hypothetical protein
MSNTPTPIFAALGLIVALAPHTVAADSAFPSSLDLHVAYCLTILQESGALMTPSLANMPLGDEFNKTMENLRKDSTSRIRHLQRYLYSGGLLSPDNTGGLLRLTMATAQAKDDLAKEPASTPYTECTVKAALTHSCPGVTAEAAQCIENTCGHLRNEIEQRWLSCAHIEAELPF